jgi:hypothetical protein
MRVTPLLLLLALLLPASLPAQVQTTLYFPRFSTSAGTAGALDTSEYTGIAIANLDTTAATLTFTAYDKTGARVSGSGIENPAMRTLAAGAQLPIVDFQIFGTAITAKSPVGWIKVDSTVQKVVGFFLVFNGGLTVLDGADAFLAIYTSLLFPEIEETGTTQICIANPNVEAVSITLELLRSDGAQRASATRSVNPNGAVVESVAELFPSASAAGSDHVRATSSKGMVGFEFLAKPGVYVHGMNGKSTALGATTLYCPQYVVGGSDYISVLSIVNLDTTAGTLTLDFLNDSGTRIATRTADIAAKGKLYITSQTYFVPASSSATQGYLRITSSGVGTGAAPKVAGSIVFGDPNKAKFSTALPLVTQLETSVIFGQLASNSQYFTGAAILNPNTSSVSATVEALDEKGVRIASRTDTIAAGARRSQLLTQFFPALASQSRSSGYLRVTTDRPVASFALFGTNDFSVLAAVPPQLVPSAATINYDGNWKGFTGAERPVEMDVLGNGVTRFKLGFKFVDGSNTCTTDINIPYSTPRRITNGTFGFTFVGPGLTTEIDGTFKSANSVSGTHGVVFVTNYRCGLTIWNGTVAAGTFTMSK